MNFRIKLAEQIIEINSMYENVFHMCQDYLYLNSNPEQAIEPDFYITTESSDLLFEKQKSTQESNTFSPGYLETLSIYRKIATAMLDHDTFLMHGCVLGIEKNAYMITAASGTGKTTFAKLVCSQCPDTIILNGDKPLIQTDVTSGMIQACGTPWCGKEHYNRNAIMPLKAIYLLERGAVNDIEKISFSQAFPMLLQQTYRPDHILSMKKTLFLLNMLQHIHFYRIKVPYYQSLADLDPTVTRPFLTSISEYS